MRPTPRATRLDADSTLVTCLVTNPTYTYSSLLLTKVERLNQPYVALVSTATEGFLTVEPPPHKLALLVHGHLPEHPTSNPDPNPNPNPNPNPSPNPNPNPTPNQVEAATASSWEAMKVEGTFGSALLPICVMRRPKGTGADASRTGSRATSSAAKSSLSDDLQRELASFGR